jgi:hypothetical protein
MAGRCEYKVVELREKLIGGRVSGEDVQTVLNEHAAQDWELKALKTVGGEINPLRIFLTFEREIVR